MTSAGPGSSVSQARDAGSRVVKVFDSSFKEIKREMHISCGEAYILPSFVSNSLNLGWPLKQASRLYLASARITGVHRHSCLPISRPAFSLTSSFPADKIQGPPFSSEDSTSCRSSYQASSSQLDTVSKVKGRDSAAMPVVGLGSRKGHTGYRFHSPRLANSCLF